MKTESPKVLFSSAFYFEFKKIRFNGLPDQDFLKQKSSFAVIL